MRRIFPFVLLFVLGVPSAGAWTWPVSGPVVQKFSFDHAHPYAGGQHRGIDIGAAGGAAVLAPAAGVVSFAGSVPTSGQSVTIETPDGLSVTLTHLGSIGVARNAAVAEGAVVGTVGPSGTPEVDGPYVHLGIRTSTDDQGYLDPLVLLPVLPQPVPVPAAVAPPAPVPVPVAPLVPVAPPVVSEAPPAAVPPPAASEPPAPSESVTSESAAAPRSPVVVPEPVAQAPAVTAPAAAPVSLPVPPASSAAAEPPVAAESSVGVTSRAAPAKERAAEQAAEAEPAIEPVRLVAPSGKAAQATLPGTAAIPGSRPFVLLAGPLPREAMPAPFGAPPLTRTTAVRTVASPPDRRPVRSTTPAEALRRSIATQPLTAAPAAPHRPRSLAPFLLALLAFGGLAASGLAAVRIIRSPSPTSEGARPVAVVAEDPRRARMAVREWAAPHRPRGGLRRAGGRVRALPPAQGERRPDGQRDGRARHAGDGGRRPERRLAA
jgi:hypothetical protein